MEGTNLLPLSSPPLFRTPFPLEIIPNYSSVSPCTEHVFSISSPQKSQGFVHCPPQMRGDLQSSKPAVDPKQKGSCLSQP